MSKKRTEFRATVREQKGLIVVGKIQSKALVPFINKKVKVTVEENGIKTHTKVRD